MYTHKQVQLVDSWGGGGLGEAFLSVHPQLISSFRQPPMTKVYIYIYLYRYVCVCVSRSCLAHTRADMYGGLVMKTHKQVQLVDSEKGGGLGKK